MRLIDFLEKHADEKRVSFHMPGHKGSDFYERAGYGNILQKLVDMDITEIDGADNLFQPEGLLRRMMEGYARLYNAKKSFMLINGSSCGIMAAIVSVIDGSRDSLILASNCHKSAINGLQASKGRPVYIHPEYLPEWGIGGSINPDDVSRAIKQCPKAKAVFITSPNYYGICSDVGSIAEEVHKNGMILIVDQAHGAHLPFMNRSLSAELNGADIVINSTHKTMASFTQTAILNLCSDRVDIERLENALQIFESSSPSYMLMASMDINLKIMENAGAAFIHEWESCLRRFYREASAIKGLKIMTEESIPMFDRTKLNLDFSAIGLDGMELHEVLLKEGIDSELFTGNLVMAMTGIGNVKKDYERLISALKKISQNCSAKGKDLFYKGSESKLYYKDREIRDTGHKTDKVHFTSAGGRVSKYGIIPYPPGIPLISAGQVMDWETLQYAYSLRKQGIKVMGMDLEGYVMCGACSDEEIE